MLSPGQKIQLKVNRKGKILDIPVTLGSAANKAAPIVISQKLGIEIENLTPDLARKLGYVEGEEGVVISKIKPGSPAAMAGLRPGCLIQAVNHKKIANISEYESVLTESAQNKRILLLVRQGKLTRFYSIRLD
jgi:serine protease Do